MNSLRLRQLSALFAAPLLLSPSAAELAFAPSEGSSLRYSMSQTLVMDLEEMEMKIFVDGEEHPGQDLGDMQATITENESLIFVDEYRKMGDGSPLLISRTYETLSSEGTQEATGPEGEDVSEEESKTTELEGMTVLFAWDAEAEEWAASFAEDSEGDEEMLEDLEADVFFTALLPDEELEAGATWEIEPRLFLEATNPVGDIPWDEAEDEEDGDTEEQMLDNLEGTVTAEFVGYAEEDGVELATIRFTASLTSEFEDNPPMEEDMEIEMEISQTMSFEIELEGDLVWDVAGGHARSLSLGGPISLDQDMVQSVEGEFSFETNMHQGFSGRLEIEITID